MSGGIVIWWILEYDQTAPCHCGYIPGIINIKDWVTGYLENRIRADIIYILDDNINA